MGQTRWSDWGEWKSRCALGLCGADVRARLGAFALHRLRIAARRAAGRTNLFEGLEPRLPSDPEQAWHLLETHAVTTNTREGKAYKEWLFARVDDRHAPTPSVLEAGASLMLRDVARSYLRGECLRHGTRSIDDHIAAEHATELTYRDLLPDEWTPCDALQARELGTLARAEADAWFTEMNFRERLGLTARLHGVPLTHPDLLACCACGKSLLSMLVREAIERLPGRLEVRYPEEEPHDRFALATAIFRALEKSALMWAQRECLLPMLFTMGTAAPACAEMQGGMVR